MPATKQKNVKTSTTPVDVDGQGRMVGQSPAMQEVYHKIGRAAVSDETVLVLGESGTGKELVAQLIHQNSDRVDNPFVVVDCGAMPSSLIESALFGHVKGAYTDAHTARKGKFQQADSGTIFLDEIGELPIEVQMKLLRVLQEREVEPMGGTETHAVDVRIIAATNRRLETAIEQKTFREDLYYRLNVIPHFPTTAAGTKRGYSGTHRPVHPPVRRRISTSQNWHLRERCETSYGASVARKRPRIRKCYQAGTRDVFRTNVIARAFRSDARKIDPDQRVGKP